MFRLTPDWPLLLQFDWPMCCSPQPTSTLASLLSLSASLANASISSSRPLGMDLRHRPSPLPLGQTDRPLPASASGTSLRPPPRCRDRSLPIGHVGRLPGPPNSLQTPALSPRSLAPLAGREECSKGAFDVFSGAFALSTHNTRAACSRQAPLTKPRKHVAPLCASSSRLPTSLATQAAAVAELDS